MEGGSEAEGAEISGDSGTAAVAVATTEEDTNAASVELLIIDMPVCGDVSKDD